MLKEFRQIHEQTGITVIYATDREDTVRMPGTRLVVMNEGMDLPGGRARRDL